MRKSRQDFTNNTTISFGRTGERRAKKRLQMPLLFLGRPQRDLAVTLFCFLADVVSVRGLAGQLATAKLDILNPKIVNPIWPRTPFWVQNIVRHFGFRISHVAVPKMQIV